MSTHDTSSAVPRSSDGTSSEAPDGTSSEAAGVTALATLSDDAARSGAGSGTALPGDVVRSDGAAPPGAAAADSRTRPSALRNPWALGLIGIILPVLLVLVWHVLSTNGTFSPVQLPQPSAVLAAGWELLRSGDLWLHVGISTQRVIVGFLVGSGLGLLLGAWLGLSPWARAIGSPTIGALRAVPSLAWVPLLLLWIGIGENSKVTLVAIGAFFPVYTTVSAALRHVDRHLIEAARSFGLRGVKLFTTVQLPAVLPSVISGLRLALAQAWLFLVAAELLGSSMGLGFLLTDSQNNGRTDRLLLAIVLLAVLGKLTDALLGVFERWTQRRWSVAGAR